MTTTVPMSKEEREERGRAFLDALDLERDARRAYYDHNGKDGTEDALNAAILIRKEAARLVAECMDHEDWDRAKAKLRAKEAHPWDKRDSQVANAITIGAAFMLAVMLGTAMYVRSDRVLTILAGVGAAIALAMIVVFQGARIIAEKGARKE